MRELRLPSVRAVWLGAALADGVLLIAHQAGADPRWLGLTSILVLSASAFLVAAWVAAILFFGRQHAQRGMAYIGLLALQVLFTLLLLEPR
jgi:hypothetical protein